ncbi:hypothetical protein PSTT_07023, partial [Puccinia striiformis]
IAWNHDGDEGHPPSITVLLNWLERDNNYKRWRQDTTKVAIRWEVVAELKAHGIAHRNGAVCCLLFQSIDSFAFPAHMRIICKHWTGLDPLMDPLMTHADEASGNAHETYLHAHSPCVHISLIAMTTRRAPRLGVSWDTDATDSHPSSIITLIDWLGANNNYSRYRGAHCKRMVLLEIERHLLMQGIKNRSVRDEQHNFNRHLSGVCVTIENCIGLWKNRFQSLRGLRLRIANKQDMVRAAAWIMACVVLHNHLNQGEDFEFEPDSPPAGKPDDPHGATDSPQTGQASAAGTQKQLRVLAQARESRENGGSY